MDVSQAIERIYSAVANGNINVTNTTTTKPGGFSIPLKITSENNRIMYTGTFSDKTINLVYRAKWNNPVIDLHHYDCYYAMVTTHQHDSISDHTSNSWKSWHFINTEIKLVDPTFRALYCLQCNSCFEIADHTGVYNLCVYLTNDDYLKFGFIKFTDHVPTEFITVAAGTYIKFASAWWNTSSWYFGQVVIITGIKYYYESQLLNQNIFVFDEDTVESITAETVTYQGCTSGGSPYLEFSRQPVPADYGILFIDLFSGGNPKCRLTIGGTASGMTDAYIAGYSVPFDLR